MNRIAMIVNGIVENIAAWDGISTWDPEGYTLINVTGNLEIEPGWLLTDGVFYPPSASVKPLADSLNEKFNSMTLEEQADFAPLKSAVKLELEQGRNEVAKLIIQRATVPPELEELKTQMLEMF